MAASIGDSGPYSGEVAPGGPPDTRELAGLIVTKLAVDKEMSNNCYLLRCRATDEQVLIDAAAEPEQPAAAGRAVGADQGDHHPPALGPPPRPRGRRRRRPVPSPWPAQPDAAAITEQTGVDVDDQVQHGDTIEFGDVRLEVIHLVGHTPGSIALLYDDPDGTPHLWTGDSLFPGGVGNTFGDKDAFTIAGRRRLAPRSSTGCPTRPGSTRATATTRSSATSGRTSRSGANAAGECVACVIRIVALSAPSV